MKDANQFPETCLFPETDGNQVYHCLDPRLIEAKLTGLPGRYRFLRPAPHSAGCMVGDCFIVDERGHRHPEHWRPAPFPAKILGALAFTVQEETAMSASAFTVRREKPDERRQEHSLSVMELMYMEEANDDERGQDQAAQRTPGMVEGEAYKRLKSAGDALKTFDASFAEWYLYKAGVRVGVLANRMEMLRKDMNEITDKAGSNDDYCRIIARDGLNRAVATVLYRSLSKGVLEEIQRMREAKL